MPPVLKSGSLILLEPSEPVQGCNGIALPFYMQGTLFVPRTGYRLPKLKTFETFFISGEEFIFRDPYTITIMELKQHSKAIQQLTLRVLMSYIYMEHPFLMFPDHTQRRTTVGRTPLDE